MNSPFTDKNVSYPYPERGKVIFNFNNILNGVTNCSDNTVNYVNNTICGNLVAVDDPSTVDCNNL